MHHKFCNVKDINLIFFKYYHYDLFKGILRKLLNLYLQLEFSVRILDDKALFLGVMK